MQQKKLIPIPLLIKGCNQLLTEDKPLLRHKTLLSYQSIIQRFIQWKNENTEKNTPDYIRSLLTAGRSLRTAHTAAATLKNYLKRLQKKLPQYLVNDLEDFKNIRFHSKSPAYFSTEQIQKLKKAIQKTQKRQLWVACEIMFYCFIRPNEIRHLQIQDINFKHWKILIRAEHAKNKKDQYVSVPPPLRLSLSPYKKFERSQAHYYLFSDTKKLWPGAKLLGRDTLSKAFKEFLKITDLTGKKLVFYSWKHTGVVTAVKAGINIKDIQVQLRHHSLDMVNEYLKNLGVFDLDDFDNKMPNI